MRYIDADALIEKIQETVCTKCGDIYDGIKCKSCGIDDTLNFLEDAPTADVVPREEYEKAKAEAIKEFADRLKQRKYGINWYGDDVCYIVEANEIDNLVAEMTEGK